MVPFSHLADPKLWGLITIYVKLELTCTKYLPLGRPWMKMLSSDALSAA